MITHVAIDNAENLVRDLSSKAVLNTDRAGLQQYYMKRDIARKQQAEKQETNNRLSQLEQDMSEIKMLLRQLAEKGND